MSRARRPQPAVADPGPLRLAAPSLASAIEPALTLADVCKLRRESRRTGERERSAGLWPRPDFFVGTGTRKSPRWRAETIRRWIGEGGRTP
jgi:hypothetical protein